MDMDTQGDLLQGRLPETPADDNLEARLKFHYLLLCVAMIAGILVCGGVSFFLWWHTTRLVRPQLEQSRRAVANYHRVEEPLIKDIISKLDGYGLQNREFTNILQRYPALFPRYQRGPAAAAAPAVVPATSALPASSLAPLPAATPAPVKPPTR